MSVARFSWVPNLYNLNFLLENHRPQPDPVNSYRDWLYIYITHNSIIYTHIIYTIIYTVNSWYPIRFHFSDLWGGASASSVASQRASHKRSRCGTVEGGHWIWCHGRVTRRKRCTSSYWRSRKLHLLVSSNLVHVDVVKGFQSLAKRLVLGWIWPRLRTTKEGLWVFGEDADSMPGLWVLDMSRQVCKLQTVYHCVPKVNPAPAEEEKWLGTGGWFCFGSRTFDWTHWSRLLEHLAWQVWSPRESEGVPGHVRKRACQKDGMSWLSRGWKVVSRRRHCTVQVGRSLRRNVEIRRSFF